MLRQYAVLIIGIVVVGGCATAEPTLKVSPRDVSGTYCAPLFIVPSVPSRLKPLASEIPSPLSSRSDGQPAADGLSSESHQIAEIIGVLDLVRETRALEVQGAQLPDGARPRLVEVRQDLADQLMMSFFEVSSVVNRVDCEVTRANHVAGALSESRDRRAQRYEITAIVGDALIGIVGGAFTLAVKETAAGIADVVGGSFATSFGLSAAFVGGEHEFFHPDRTNMLRELWEAPQVPTVFPVSVWRFLNWPLSEAAEYRSRRDELLAEWQNDGLIGEPGKIDRRAMLFFGTGGTYDIDDLRARAQMLEVIKTSLNVMVQYLYLLSQEVLHHQQVAVR
jgi:hypothetical protein